MSDLVGNPEDRFSHNEAQIKNIGSDQLPLPFSLAAPFSHMQKTDFSHNAVLIILCNVSAA